MKLLPALSALAFLLSANHSFADGDGHDHHTKHEAVKAENTMKFEIIEQAHSQGFPFTVKLTDIKTGKTISEADLKTVHTQKLHLLVVDPSLSEYHHIHPTANADGSWNSYFVPASHDNFRVWADVTRADTGKQEYIIADIHNPMQEKAVIDKTVKLSAEVEGYKFDLKIDGELKNGEETMASITVSKDGKPFAGLEPVMGAFAHLVGFSEDYKTIMHIHPMGKEPEKSSERGGSVLEFHISPQASGFIKIFAQFRIEGKDIFAPFGVMVK